MRVLACDPGSQFGWATDATGKLEWGTEDFRIKGGESSGNRWRRFGEWLLDATLRKNPARMVLGRDRTIECDIVPKIDIIVYERSVFMPKGRAAAEIAAGFTTRLEEHCERHGIALQPVAVQTLKAFALPKVKRKKGDPRMDRSKEAMMGAARLRLSSQSSPVALDQTKSLTEHEADALWIYWYCKEALCTKS